MQEVRPLEEQRDEFAQRRLIATPIAGMIAWTIVTVSVGWGCLRSDLPYCFYSSFVLFLLCVFNFSNHLRKFPPLGALLSQACCRQRIFTQQLFIAG